MNEYRIPASPGESELTEKRSRFLGHVRMVESEEEAKAFIAEMKKKYYDARHNCWCYSIRDGAERYSDDGEPQGSAGTPMLEVLRRRGVTNAVCVVTRYFGGVLLGTGGLLRAYTQSTADALDAAGVAVVRAWTEAEARCSYAQAERMKTEAAALGAEATPCIRVYNKCDRYFGILPHGENTVCISAKSGEGTAELLQALSELLDRGRKRVKLLIPYRDAGLMDSLQREAAVLRVEYTDAGIEAEAVVPPELFGRVTAYIPGYTEPKEDWET